MKALLIGTYARDEQYSLLGFANALARGLPSHGIETRVLSPSVVMGKSKLARGKMSTLLGHLDKLVLFPRQLKRALEWADVVHMVDHGLAVYVRHVTGKPHVVTCNDLIAMRAARGEIPEWQTKSTSGAFQTMISDGLSRARHVACISEATRADVCRLTSVPQSRTSVIYDSLFHPFSPMPLEERATHLRKLEIPDGPFLLHIGRDVPTKNRIGVLKIFEILHREGKLGALHLVMAGKPLGPTERAWVSERRLESVVFERSHLSNDELRALYSSASALVFPSLCEGFGLPIIEAQACGCPVFTSNRAPMTEVGGKAAVYFDPTQPLEGAQVIERELGDAENARRIKEAGFENARRFAPERMFCEYAELYRRLS